MPGNPLPTLHEIALDGLPTGALTEKSEIELFPGYRSDVLVKAPVNASGEYYLVDDNMLDDRTGADGSPEPIRWIAKLVVTGQPVQDGSAACGPVDRPAAQGHSRERGDRQPDTVSTGLSSSGREDKSTSCSPGRSFRDDQARRLEQRQYLLPDTGAASPPGQDRAMVRRQPERTVSPDDKPLDVVTSVPHPYQSVLDHQGDEGRRKKRESGRCAQDGVQRPDVARYSRDEAGIYLRVTDAVQGLHGQFRGALSHPRSRGSRA